MSRIRRSLLGLLLVVLGLACADLTRMAIDRPPAELPAAVYVRGEGGALVVSGSPDGEPIRNVLFSTRDDRLIAHPDRDVVDRLLDRLGVTTPLEPVYYTSSWPGHPAGERPTEFVTLDEWSRRVEAELDEDRRELEAAIRRLREQQRRLGRQAGCALDADCLPPGISR